jgi:MFS superfamily sulfate permease-like transporter
VLATDLLIGIAIGIMVKLAVHMLNGVPLRSLFKPYLDIEEHGDKTLLVRASGSAVFSNWIPFKRQLEDVGLGQKNNVIIDLSDTKLVDHSVMEKLHELQGEFEEEGLALTITGLDLHRPLSEHEFATRKRSLKSLKRVTIIAEAALQDRLVGDITRLGASGYTLIPCVGAGRRDLAAGGPPRDSQIRIEIVTPRSTSDAILDYLRRDILKDHQLTACVETVDVVNPDHF